MANKIGTQTGITASKLVFEQKMPGHKDAFENLAKTQGELVRGHNEFIDDIAELEGRLSRLPFLSAQASG